MPRIQLAGAPPLVLVIAGAAAGALAATAALRFSPSSPKAGKSSKPKPNKPACSACEDKDTKKLTEDEVREKLATRPLWIYCETSGSPSIVRHLVAKNFVGAFEFLQKIAEVAEERSHHPDFNLTSYRNVSVKIYTHAVGGLTDYDFALADAIDALPVTYSPKFLKDQQARLGKGK
mmetsp:Transcript_28339/g.63302  ORF Transcript_28339/g.63302 Transcript_28339/m.63302 type:complete len:176 (+) Transcript_28339:21-548(+)